MTVVWQSLVKLGVTVYLLFGGYTLFIGFLEKNRKKKDHRRARFDRADDRDCRDSEAAV